MNQKKYNFEDDYFEKSSRREDQDIDSILDPYIDL